jgi:hypothetical protein
MAAGTVMAPITSRFVSLTPGEQSQLATSARILSNLLTKLDRKSTARLDTKTIRAIVTPVVWVEMIESLIRERAESQ